MDKNIQYILEVAVAVESQGRQKNYISHLQH